MPIVYLATPSADLLLGRGELSRGACTGPGPSIHTGAPMLPTYTRGAARRRQLIRTEASQLRQAEALADVVRPFAAVLLRSHAEQCAEGGVAGESCERGCVSVQHPNGGSNL